MAARRSRRTPIAGNITAEPDQKMVPSSGPNSTLTPSSDQPRKTMTVPSRLRKDIRAYQGAEMRLAGMDWLTVADTLGFKSTKSAMKEVMTYVSDFYERDKSELAQAITMEIARVDALQAAHWQTAMEGDISSGRFVLDLIKARATLLGLSMPATVVQQNNSTILVGGNEKDYVSALTQLRAMAEASGMEVVDGEVVE